MYTNLVLRRASVSRISDSWSEDDYDVLDGERVIGSIYLATDCPGSPWFWGVSFEVIHRKSYGYANSFDEAKVGFRAEYERCQKTS